MQTGITPAPAGNSGLDIINSLTRQDHPRPCGEQKFQVPVTWIESGSPPPLRGTGDGVMFFCPSLRITPAPAGNRGGLCNGAYPQRDHPRPCGEQPAKAQVQSLAEGSPPPLRGTVACSSLSWRRCRITPAPAGNSDEPSDIRKNVGDHPRPCGEQVWPDKPVSIQEGSPPPLRGTDRSGKSRYQTNRITPAPAGNSTLSTILVSPVKDHPRPCGEQGLKLHRLNLMQGSPPPLRGTVTKTLTAPQREGITPAPAGNSNLLGSGSTVNRDHPRPCGEQPNPIPNNFSLTGSPPPLRGTVPLGSCPVLPNRITPAPAGNRKIAA